jgi:hypothetical protein
MSKKNSKKAENGVVAALDSAATGIATAVVIKAVAMVAAARGASVFGVRHAMCLLPRVTGSKRAQAIACYRATGDSKAIGGLLLPLCGTLAHNADCRAGNDRALIGEVSKSGCMVGYMRYVDEASEKSLNDAGVIQPQVDALVNYLTSGAPLFAVAEDDAKKVPGAVEADTRAQADKFLAAYNAALKLAEMAKA